MLILFKSKAVITVYPAAFNTLFCNIEESCSSFLSPVFQSSQMTSPSPIVLVQSLRFRLKCDENNFISSAANLLSFHTRSSVASTQLCPSESICSDVLWRALKIKTNCCWDESWAWTEFNFFFSQPTSFVNEADVLSRGYFVYLCEDRKSVV